MTAAQPDWTTQVAFQDQPVTVLPTLTPFPVPSFIPVGDTSNAQSVAVSLRLPLSAAGNRYAVTLEWDDNGIIVGADTITFHSQISYYESMSPLLWQVPARGASAIMFSQGDDNSPLDVGVTKSNRPLSSAALTPFGVALGRVRLDTGSVNVPASSSSATFYVPPVARQAYLRLSDTGAKITFTVNGITPVSGAMQSNDLALVVGTGGTQDLLIPVPVTGLEIFMTNTDAGAAHFGHVTVWDAS